MDSSFVKTKIQLKKEALAEHKHLSELFVKDRFEFELERKRAIEKTIDNSVNKKNKKNLIKLQEQWDNILKHSGSRHNRFVLIQMLFTNHINRFRAVLKNFREI